jgi:hypothetical protein
VSEKRRAITHGETYCPACDRIFDGERCPNCNTLLMRIRLGTATGSSQSIPSFDAFPRGSARFSRPRSKLPMAPAPRRWPWVVAAIAAAGAIGALAALYT